MCGEQINYKSYQTVLDLGCDKKTKAVKREPKPTMSKKRTKTGCMTCRRRKKKCDELKTGGKCQACIRNFLDCHWPGEEPVEAAATAPAEVSVPESPKITEKSVPKTPDFKGADAYPSPVMSPKAEGVSSPTSCMDIKSLTLPPIQEKVSVSKVSKPKAKKAKKVQGAQFFITSFDAGKALCQIKS